jgi:hypothetical protein
MGEAERDSIQYLPSPTNKYYLLLNSVFKPFECDDTRNVGVPPLKDALPATNRVVFLSLSALPTVI